MPSIPSASPSTPPSTHAGGHKNGLAWRAELVATLEHDLRNSLTTVLGALQTVSRSDHASDDPEIAALVAAGLTQAQKMRQLLGEMLSACSAVDPALSPRDLVELVMEAGGEQGAVAVEVAPGLQPVRLSAAGLRRALAPLLTRLRSCPGGVRVSLAPEGGGCRITVAADGLQTWWVPGLTARLVTAMGGRVTEADDEGTPAVSLVFA